MAEPTRRARKLLMGYGFASSFAGNLVAPFFGLFLFELTHGSFLQTGLIGQVPGAISVLMGYLWARFSDRSGRRKLFVQISIATSGAASLALSFVESAEQAFAVQVAGALTGSAGGAAFSALVAEVFKERRGEALGRYSAATVLGGFLGSLASGALYTQVGFRNALRVSAALNLVPLILITLLPETNSGKPESSGKLLPRIPPSFWRLFTARLLMSLPGALSGPVFAIYYIRYLGGSPESWAALSAVTTLFGLASIPYGRMADRLPVNRMFALAGLGWLALYTGYYLSPSPYIFAVFFVLPVWPAFWIAYSKALMDVSDQTERAALFAFESILSSIYGAALAALSGYLADLFGPRQLFLLSAASAGLAAAAVQPLVKGFGAAEG
ncbi:MAG: MFS transporter [Thermofilum sp.]